MRKLIMALAALAAVPAAMALAADDSAKALYESKCSMCHDIERSSTIRMTAAEWRETVMRMKDDNGCPLSKEEAEKIIKYLTETRGSK